MILKIKEDGFTVDVNKYFLYQVIQKSIEKAGGVSKLSIILVNDYKIKRLCKNISNNLRKWQKGLSRIQLPLDVFLLLCNFLNLNDVNSNILSIRLKRTKNGIFKYPLLIDSNWIYLSEMIRCEGHLTNKRIILENTDTELLNKFKNS